MYFSAIMRKPEAYSARIAGHHPLKKNILQLMRIHLFVVLLIIVTAGILRATPAKAQEISGEMVAMELNQVSLETALKQLEQQTLFVYFYRKADIKTVTNLTLPFGTRTVAETLRELLKNTAFTFRQSGKNVFIERITDQSGYVVKGRVLDLQHQPLPAVLVQLSKNSQPVKATQTDTGGRFNLPVSEKGTYLLQFSALGMDSITVAITLADQPVVILPDLTLGNTPIRLNQVNITARKPLIEQKIDRTVVNVGQMISSTGGNALEVLERAPGVIVNQDGSNGKMGVLILVDDKPTYLSGDNLVGYLRSLPASQLDQIELMSNPPAKYDAAGTAGLINLKIKKNTAEGFNGSLSVSQGEGIYGRSTGSVNLNYRTGKVNLFLNGGYSDQHYYNTIGLQRNYFDVGGNLATIYKESAVSKVAFRSPNVKFGMDYELSPKTTLGFVVTSNRLSGTVNKPVTSTLSNGQGGLDSTIEANNHDVNHFQNQAVNLNYTHQYGRAGRTITADVDYAGYQKHTDQTFVNNTFLPDGTQTDSQTITDHLPTDTRIYAAKTDYTQPLKNGAKLEAGLKSSLVNTDNEADYFDVANGISTVDEQNSNHFLYKENINAAYLNYSQSFKRLSVQAGLRAENTNASGHQLGNTLHPDSAFSQHYTDLFPTAFLLYKLDTAGYNQLNFSYGRRITRPYYQDLNPFVNIVDKFTHIAGNPFLKPAFSTEFKLQYNYNSVFSIGLLYGKTTDNQQEIISQNANVFTSTTGNLGEVITKGVTFDLNLHPAKGWDGDLHVGVTNNAYKGLVDNNGLNVSGTFVYVQDGNQFDLGQGWSTELAGFFISKRPIGQFNLNALGLVNAGIQKKMLHNKAAIKLAARDIFNTNYSSGSITGIPGASAVYQNHSDSRVVTLGFSYNFGTQGKAPKKRDVGSAQSEQNRVK